MVCDPLVSAGMPLRNEAEFLEEALRSLLGQDYGNMEIILSDNASFDATTKICRRWAGEDTRIRFLRHRQDVGAHSNFSGLVPAARGAYFFWAAGHDLWDPTFVRKCVAVLEGEPEAVLAYPRTMIIDRDGTPLGVTPFRMDTRGMGAAQRYVHFLWHTDCNPVYGVWRRGALLQSGLFRDIWGPDQLLLAEMALKGAFALVDEPLWFRRRNRAPEAIWDRTARRLSDLNPLTRKPQSLLQCNRVLKEAHLQLLRETPLPRMQRRILALHTLFAFAVRSDVFPGAAFLKSLLKSILPSALQRRVVTWLRGG